EPKGKAVADKPLLSGRGFLFLGGARIRPQEERPESLGDSMRSRPASKHGFPAGTVSTFRWRCLAMTWTLAAAACATVPNPNVVSPLSNKLSTFNYKSHGQLILL